MVSLLVSRYAAPEGDLAVGAVPRTANRRQNGVVFSIFCSTMGGGKARVLLSSPRFRHCGEIENMILLDYLPSWRCQRLACGCRATAPLCGDRWPSCLWYRNRTGRQQTEGGSVFSSPPPPLATKTRWCPNSVDRGPAKVACVNATTEWELRGDVQGVTWPVGLVTGQNGGQGGMEGRLNDSARGGPHPGSVMYGVPVARGYQACGRGSYRKRWRGWKWKLRKWSK